MFDRRLVKYFDWGFLTLTFMICAIGLITLRSATSGDAEVGLRMLWIKQMAWYGVGMTALIACILIDFKYMDRWAYAIYGVVIALLVAVLFAGKLVGGSRRWLAFGPFTLQPSELAKIAVIIVLARYYSRMLRPEGLGVKELIYPFLMTLLPFLLIVRQPDLGTGLIIYLIAGCITLFVKIERKTFIVLILLVASAVACGGFFLKDYQKQRIRTFLNPESDPLGAGYHIIQSKIAIGSGMLKGKGIRKGTQNTLSFLPEQHTDFIFSVLAEEWGFIGSVCTHILLMVFIIWGLNISYHCRNHFGTILAFGASTMIFWHTIINLGMVMGLMPVVGVPLPLVSYGGSSVLTIMICVGILLNISMRRFVTGA